MIYGVYAIYDLATGLFLSPSVDISDVSAVRSFQQALSNSGSIMNFKRDDFSLYQIGTFDVESGALEAVIPPNRLSCGSDGSIRKEIVDE